MVLPQERFYLPFFFWKVMSGDVRGFWPAKTGTFWNCLHHVWGPKCRRRRRGNVLFWNIAWWIQSIQDCQGHEKFMNSNENTSHDCIRKKSWQSIRVITCNYNIYIYICELTLLMDNILHQVEIHEPLRKLRYSPHQQHHCVHSVLLDCIMLDVCSWSFLGGNPSF